MAFGDPTITVFFGTGVNPTAFTLNDATKGQLDDATYTLGGDVGTDVTADCYSISVRRGRDREFDEFSAGTCTIQLYNWDGDYLTRNPSSPYAGNLVPGKRVRVQIWNQTIFEGIVAHWESQDDSDGIKLAELGVEDALAQLGRIEFDGWTATGSQTAGPRLDAALNRPEVNFAANRDFSTGVSVLQADPIGQGSNVLSYCQLVAQSDLGAFFATRSNQLRFRDRHDVPTNVEASQTSPRFHHDIDFCTVDEPPVLPFQSHGTTSGSDYLNTRVVVEREGGVAQPVEDAASIELYGVRTLSFSGLLQNSDEQALAMAEFLLGAVADPREHVNLIAVDLSAYPVVGMPPDRVARLDLHDFCYLSLPFDAGVLLRIEGIDHDIKVGGSHVMTLHLSEAMQAASFILDDFFYGRLDNTPLGF